MRWIDEARTTLGPRFNWLVGLALGLAMLAYVATRPLDWPATGPVTILTELTAEVSIPEADIALLLEGQPARLYLRAYPGQPIPARVVNIGSTATRDETTGQVRFPVLLAVTPPPGLTLRGGMTGRADIIIARDLAFFVLTGRASRAVLAWWSTR